jgi:hypothetical protein
LRFVSKNELERKIKAAGVTAQIVVTHNSHQPLSQTLASAFSRIISEVDPDSAIVAPPWLQLLKSLGQSYSDVKVRLCKMKSERTDLSGFSATGGSQEIRGRKYRIDIIR